MKFLSAIFSGDGMISAVASMLVLAVGVAIHVPDVANAQETKASGVDQDLHSQVPENYAKGLVAVYDPQYPPSYFIDETGEMAGYVIDFQKALATKLGIPIKAEQAKFSAIIAGILGSRYDTSFFHDTPERREKMEIVDFHRTGTALMVKAGNPTGIDLYELCGHKVGVTKGGAQSLELLPRLQAKCKDAGKPQIDALVFSGPNEGSLAVKTGRIEGWLGDAPYTGYVVRQNNGIFEKTPTADVSGVSGFAFRKGDPMVELVKQAMKAMMEDGTYQEILADWKMSELALEKPLVNGK
ncbi:MAG TPA: transporter substrate-binding domain-containing protein [Sphingomicrobium sp.]|nr:transporter substrate-binding domain-containing protein [Sphingomicrobium sp.]